DSGRGQGIDIDSPPLAQSAVGGKSSQYVSAAALGAASAERHPNAGAQDSVAGTRFVTFKRRDGSALVHPPGTLPSSTPMTRSSPPRGISNYRGTQYKQTNTYSSPNATQI